MSKQSDIIVKKDVSINRKCENEHITNAEIMESLEMLKIQVKSINDGIIDRVLYEIQQISSKVDCLTNTFSGGKNLQNRRTGVKEAKPRSGGPRQNILGWIKDGYIEQGWEFFEFVIEDPKGTIEALLNSKENMSNRKKSGESRKKAEAAFIWHKIKNVEGVQEEMKLKFEEYKEQQKIDQAKLAEEDESEQSSDHKSN